MHIYSLSRVSLTDWSNKLDQYPISTTNVLYATQNKKKRTPESKPGTLIHRFLLKESLKTERLKWDPVADEMLTHRLNPV